MKAFRDILTGSLLAGGLIVGLCFLHAQETAAPIQTRFVPSFSPVTDSLWLQINGTSNGLVFLTLNGATDEVYEVWSKTDLGLTNWTIESEVWPTNPVTMPFTVPLLDRTNALFFWAQDWTGVTGNGNATPEWWFWQYFGTLALSDTNLDSQGNTLLYDYQNGFDPNIIQFSLNFARKYVNDRAASGTIIIRGGVPFYKAILVNDTNFADANWQPYTSNVVVNLDAGDGNYNILVGLRGLSSGAQQSWLNAELILDTVPPMLAFTNPATSTVSQPMIQLQGYANESLSALTFDVSNAAGCWTNRTGYMTDRFYDTNLLEFKTKGFQCYDISLANGLNTITLHATDLAGNTTTTSAGFTLDFSGATNPPVLTVIWPQDGTQIGGDSFTLQAQVSDPTAAVSATIGSDTVQGLVDRNGNVRVRNLPLSDGTNMVTLTTTSVTGNLGTTTVNVVKSPVTVMINPLSDAQLNLPAVTVTGTVSDLGSDVWVNGIQATVNGDGSWQADNVSVNDGGMADFDVEVYPSGTTGAAVTSLKFSQPQPVKVVLSSYAQVSKSYSIVSDFPWEENFTGNWVSGGGGQWVDWGYDNGNEYPFAHVTFHYSGIYSASDGGSFGPPWEEALFYTVFNSMGILRSVESRVMMTPQGQAVDGTVSLYLVRANAMEYSDPPIYWWIVPDLPLAPEWLQINGQTLVNSGMINEDDGSVWGDTIVSAPTGVNVDVTPVATQVHQNWDYTINVQGNELNLQLAVDADRDGNVTFDAVDATSADKPYRFWVNNDNDGFDRGIDDYADLAPSGSSDADNLAISCKRDLEDYTRLWINTQGITRELLNGTFLLALEWKDVTEDPKMQLFQAAEPDGGMLYLVDSDTAQQQFASYGTHVIEWAHRNVLTKNNPFIFPANFWAKAGVSTNQPVAHLLFDAVSPGRGQLVISIYKNDGVTKLAESQPLCLKLQDVKEMYERWTVGNNPNSPPAARASRVTLPYSYDLSTPAENNFILFVHGWNLAPWEKDAFAETAFKRLYWQGYKGRFGAFQWPTGYGFGSWKTIATDPDNYDNSEFNAWNSATGLLHLLNGLNSSYPGQVYLMAHSMGNVVAGEALKLAGANQVVNTYIAMQAAVPAHCYDQIADFRTVRLYLESGTPDRYANYPTNDGPCYFNGTAGAGSYINFYNANDWALAALHWQLDQDLKPDHAYFYDGINFFAGNDMLNLPQDTYPIFAYCDEARCYALGAQAYVGGAFTTAKQIDLSEPPYNFGGQHKDHSGEFNSDNMNRALFWNQVLAQMRLE